MPMANVMRLWKRIHADPEFRSRLNRTKSQEERERILKEEELDFNDAEFEEGFRALHVKCRTLDDAQALHQFKLWWEMLRNS